jgi:hypothetical protein
LIQEGTKRRVNPGNVYHHSVQILPSSQGLIRHLITKTFGRKGLRSTHPQTQSLKASERSASQSGRYTPGKESHSGLVQLFSGVLYSLRYPDRCDQELLQAEEQKA